MEVKTNLVKELREKTGAGELEKGGGLVDEKGMVAAGGREDRVASEGSVGSYIHAGGKLGVLIEINCETDFCAKSEAFQGLVKELAMQVAAANPRCVRREEISPAVVEQERQIFTAQAEGKPAGGGVKIVEGKLEKFFKEACLLEQAYVPDPNRTVNDLLVEAGLQMREKIHVGPFLRFQLGRTPPAKGGPSQG